MRGEKYGMFVGFFLGLLEDLMFGTYPGMKALLYLITGYVSGYTNKFYYDNNMKVPMALVAVCDLLYNFGIYVFEFLLLGKTDFFYYLRRIIIPEVIYTVFFTIIVYRIFYHINYKLMKKDKKEGDSNWLLK
jgi:rod shape-determining protein MreD